MSEINDIHWDIFTRFKWQPDSVTFGRIEHWDMPKELPDGTLVGDCDDFSIACYYALREKGLKPELAVCKVPNMGGHCVCLCDGMVLDNRFRTPYLLTDNPGGYTKWSRSNGSWAKPWITFEVKSL